MNLSPSQRNAFWKHYATAWSNHAAAAGIDPGDRAASDRWRRQLIFAETGRRSLTQVSRTRGFDRLLQRVCIEAGHCERAADVEMSAMRRIRARCEDCLRQICEIEARTDLETTLARWHYIGGILKHAYQGRDWPDVPEDDLEQIFRMLDTHRRRLLRRAGWGVRRGDAEHPMGYQFDRRFARGAHTVDLAANIREVPHAQ